MRELALSVSDRTKVTVYLDGLRSPDYIEMLVHLKKGTVPQESPSPYDLLRWYAFGIWWVQDRALGKSYSGTRCDLKGKNEGGCVHEQDGSVFITLPRDCTPSLINRLIENLNAELARKRWSLMPAGPMTYRLTPVIPVAPR